MLLSFRAANVLSIRDEQRLSLIGTELNDGSGHPTRIKSGGKPVSVVPVIGIYGPNASGKTNVLAALRMMQTAVLTSVEWFSKPDPVRRIPFALDPSAATEPSFFEVDLDIDGVRYTYGFELDDERVRGKWCMPTRKAASRSGSTDMKMARSPSPARACEARNWTSPDAPDVTRCT